MNAVLEQINSTGKAFVEFSVPMLVQSGVLIVILLLIDLALRKKVKAVFRYCIWMLVLVKLVLPTSLSSPLSLGYWFGDKLAYVAESRTAAAPEAEAEAEEPALTYMLHIIEPAPIEVERHTPAVLPMVPDVEPAVTEAVSPPTAPVTPLTWQGVVFLLWLAVVIALGLLLLQRAMFVRGLVAQAKEANALMNGALEYCCKCMGVKRKVGLKVSANATSPAVCGLFRPVILLPHKLAPSLGSRGLRAVLLHELAHIRRGDLWVNLVQTVLQIMYFYNPLLWVANCVIRRVREQAIDETVLVAMGEKAQQYPQTLVNVAKLAFKRPVLSLRLIGVVESKSALAGRIKHILNRPMPKSAKIGIVGVLAVIIAGAILLPMAAARQRDGWADKDLLIKFTEQERGEPRVSRSAGKAAWQKSYDVEFAPWEELLVVAELYEAGKPMRQLGQKVFSGSSDAQTFSVNFVRTYKNDAKTIVGHSGTVGLGEEVLEIAEFTVNTQRYFSGESWGGYHGGGLRRTRARYTKKEYAELKTLFYYHSTDGGGVDEGEANFWIPGHNVTPTGSHHCVVLKMIPLSRLEYLVCEPVSGWQGLDGKTIPVDFTADRAEAIADKYKQMIVDSVEQQWAVEKQAEIETDVQAGSLEHFIGKYAMAGYPDTVAFEITRKGDVFIFSSLGGPKFEMEEAEDGLKFADGGGERFRVRYDASKNVYYLDNLGIPGKEWEPESILLTKISAKKTNAIFAATLSNGVRVELVGVCEFLKDGRNCWKPDGSKLDKAIYVSKGGVNKTTENLFGLIVRTDKPCDLEWIEIEGMVDRSNYVAVVDENGQPIRDGMYYYGIKVWLANRDKTNIRMRVAPSKWNLKATYDGKYIIGKLDPKVRFFESYETANGVSIIFNHDYGNYDCRMAAKVSRESKGPWQYYNGKRLCFSTLKTVFSPDGSKKTAAIFEGLKLSDVEHFEFGIRHPYKSVQFKNVSLRPGHKTDVQVEGGSNAPIGEASKENKKPQDPNEPSYDGRSLTELVAALSDQDFQARINAVYHLGYMGPKAKPAVPALVDALDEERLRESVLHSLGNIGVGAEDAIPALIKAIAEYAPACRWKAAESLAKIGKAALPSLKKAAGSEDIYLRIWCNAALAKQEGSDSPNLRYLAQLMKNTDKNTAGEAVRALTMLGPISKPLVPDLIEALKHSAVPKRHIAFALAQIGQDAKAAVPELVKMIQSTNPSTQRDAIYALSAIGGEDAAPAVASLIQALASKDKLVRREAANALGNIGLPASTAIEQLANILKDEDEFVRQNAAQALGKIDLTNLEPVPALIVAMKDESGRVRVAVAQALLKIGPVDKEVILAFINAADDNWKGVRYACDTFFTYLGPQHSYVIPDLIEMLKTPNERAQRLAITALGNMGEAAVPAVPYLAKNIKNPRLESVASGALRKLGPKAGAAVPGLIEMLEDKRKRFSAALVLEAIGPAAWQAIPALQNCLGQGPQVTFARALLAIDPKSAKAADELVRIAESPYVPNQWTEQPDAHYLLVKYGHDKDQHLQVLIDALANPNSRIRLSAAAYLGHLGHEADEAVDLLQKALKDDDPEARVEAAHAILMLGPSRLLRKQAVDVILSSLDGKETMTQVRAAGALQSFGPEEKWVVPALITKIHARELRTRKAVVEALGNIGPGAKEALPFLKRLLKDEDWWIRQSAAQAIRMIDDKTAVEVEVEGAWGEAVDGLQLRLRTEKLVWESSEAPILKADVRNNGTKMKAVPMFPLGYLVEIDGVSYSDQVVRSHWASDTWNAQVRLAPGEERIGVEISLDEHTKYSKGDLRGALGPGKHVVCIGFPHDALASKENQFFSNPVEIVILPTDSDVKHKPDVQVEGEIAWGEKVDGLQVGLKFDSGNRMYRQEELVTFKLYVRNTSNKDIDLPYREPPTLEPPVIKDSTGRIPRDSTGNSLFPQGFFGGTHNYVVKTLRAGQTAFIAKIYLKLDDSNEYDNKILHINLPVGNYLVTQMYRFGPGGKTYRFGADSQTAWSGQLTTGALQLTVLPKQVAVQVEVEKAHDKAQIENIINQLWTAIEAKDAKRVKKLAPSKEFIRKDFDINKWILKQAARRAQLIEKENHDISKMESVAIEGDKAAAVTRTQGEGIAYLFKKTGNQWTLYEMIFGSLSPAGPASVIYGWRQTELKRESWAEYLKAGELLHKGTDRAEMAKRFSSIGQRYPLARVSKICSELGILLTEMAAEDKEFVEPGDIESLSADERINYYIFKLRNVAEQEMFVPGKCRVLYYPKTPNSAAVALRGMGKTVIPAMIVLLDDRRPTHSVGLAMNNAVILRYCDVALEIIEAIAEQKFDKRTERGAFLSTAGSKTREEIISRVKVWWEQDKQKTGVEVEAARAKKTASQQLSFGPVTERVLSFSFLKDSAHLDLDTGRYGKEQPGRDLIAAAGESDRRVRSGLDMVAIPVEARRWESSPQEVLGEVAKGKPQRHARLGGPESRRTFFFKTREGSVGVLQILPLQDSSGSVKVRYKLVQGRQDVKETESRNITRHRGVFKMNEEMPVNLDCPVVKDVWGRDQRPFKVETVEFVKKDERLHCLVKIGGATAADGKFIVRVNIRGKESRDSAREALLAVREFLFETQCFFADRPLVIGEVQDLDFGSIPQFAMATSFEVVIEDITQRVETAKKQQDVTTFRGAFKKGEPIPVNLACPAVKDVWGNDQRPFKVETVEFAKKDDHLYCSVKIDGATSADGKFIVWVKIYDRESRDSASGEGIVDPRGFLFETQCDIAYMPLLIKEVQELDFGPIFEDVTSFEVEIVDITRKAESAEESSETDVEVEREGGWGEVVEGVQVRLLAYKVRWKVDEVPTLKADVRNGGERRIHLPESPDYCLVQVDGRWFFITGYEPGKEVSLSTRVLDFLPGQQRKGIPLELSDKWETMLDSEVALGAYVRHSGIITGPGLRSRLRLTPGKHTIRVSFIVTATGMRVGINPLALLQVVSNPVEIVILPTDSDVKHKPDVEVEVAGGKTAKSYRKRYFATLVVTDDGVVFKGQKLTWEQVREKLKTVPERQITALEVAVAPAIVPENLRGSAMLKWVSQSAGFQKAAQLRQDLGFEYLSNVGVDRVSSRRGPVSVRFEDALRFGERIPVALMSFEEQPLLRTTSIEFKKAGADIRAVLKAAVTSYPKKSWEIGVRLLDAQGRQITSEVETFENSGLARGYPVHTQEEMNFSFGQAGDLANAKRFEVKLRQFTNKLAAGKTAVPVEVERKAGSVVQVKVLGPQGEPVKGASVELQIFVGGDVDDMANYRAQRVFTDANGLYVFEGLQTDANGLYVFKALETGSAGIGRAFTAEDGSMSGVPYGLMFDFEIGPGKSYDITLGGKGRPVVGRLVPASGNAGDIDWSKAWAYFGLRAAPMTMGFMEDNLKILRAMIKSEGGDFYRKDTVKINPDGTFRIDDVRAGHYMLRVKVIEEPKKGGFNLFRDVRIPLMRDGTTETPLNLGSLAVSHGDYKAPRHIDNHFLGSLTLDKDIPVILKAGNDEEPDVVSAKSIRFSKDGESVTAALDVEWKSIVADRWRARLTLLSGNGSYVAWDNVFFETFKIIEKYPQLFKEQLKFSLGRQPDLSAIPRFTITIQPVSEILTGNEQPGTGAEIGRVDAERVKAGEFEELSVKFVGIWMHWQDVEFTVRGDGSVRFSMNKGPKDKTRYETAFKLSGEHLAELSGLLRRTNWLTAPGANVQPRYSDATRIDISLTREDKVHSVWCHDRNAEPYLSLIIFLKRIHRQEYLLYQMTVPGVPGRNSAFGDVYQQIRAEKGEPVSAHPHRILDFSRFVRPSVELIGHPDENHYETVAIAVKILGKLKAEQVRPQITDLTTAERKEHYTAAVIRTEDIRAAAVEALTELGGEQARRHVRDMAKNHRSWRRVVNEAIVESLLELDKDNCAELLKDMAAKTKKASWGLIRLRSAALPAIVEILEVRDTRYMGQIYLIRQYIDHWEEVTKPIDARVIEAVQRNLDYRLGRGPSWTQYHKEFLQLAGAPELPSKDARQIAEEFLAAVKTNDQMKIGAIARTGGGSWPQRLAKLKSLPGLQQFEITEVYADTNDNIAWAIAAATGPDNENSTRARIILNFLSGSVWRIFNIAIERPEIAERMRKRYLENHPNAKPVPAKESSRPAVKTDVWIGSEMTGAEADIEDRIRAVIDKFWAAVEADDFGRVRQLSQIDMLEKRSALEQTLKEVNEERKQLLSRGIDISTIMNVYIRGDEAVAVGKVNKGRIMWYYLEKGPDGWLVKLFDDAPKERTIEEIFTQSRGHIGKTGVEVEGTGQKESKITFEKTTHDFGEIGPVTNQSCEFKFTNTGDGLLKITKIKECCGISTVLRKREYAPGESGTIKVTYKAGSKTSGTSKPLYVNSNDKKNPRVTLTIKARIVVKVEHKPEKLELSLKDEDTGRPKITLTSLDNQPFAITQFKSTANSITADFEPSVKKTKFVLEPKVDMEKLQRSLNGRISISLTHPQCRTVTIPFSTLPRFKITPPSLITLKAELQKPTKRKVRILNNYNEDFEIESASSQKGIVKVLSQEKTRGGYQFELEITPPAAEGNKRFFTDVFIVNIKGGEVLKISCRGFYSRK